MFAWDAYGNQSGQNVTLWWEEKWLEENAFGTFVLCISCTGDEGQLGSSFLWNGRGGWGGQSICRKSSSQMVNEIADRNDLCGYWQTLHCQTNQRYTEDEVTCKSGGSDVAIVRSD